MVSSPSNSNDSFLDIAANLPNLEDFYALPNETFLNILVFTILPDVDMWHHLSVCTKVQCEFVQHVVTQSTLLRRLNKRIHHLIRTSDIALLCVSLTHDGHLENTNYPSFQLKAKKTISIDIHDHHLSPRALHHIENLIKDTPNIIRFSVSGDVRLWNYKQVARHLTNIIQILAGNRNLSVLIVDAPVDLTAEIRGAINIPFLKLRSYHPEATLSHPITWHALRQLHLQLHQPHDEPAELLLQLGRDAFPNIKHVTLEVHRCMRYVDFFLLNVSGTITELTLLYNGTATDVLAIPAAPNLNTVSCYIHNSQQLFGERMTALRTLNLHGFGPSFILYPRRPQIHTAKLLDKLLIHLLQSDMTPAINTNKLHPFDELHFFSNPWDLRELSIYAYWGLHCVDENFKFNFLDSNGRQILPRGLERTITRITEPV